MNIIDFPEKTLRPANDGWLPDEAEAYRQRAVEYAGEAFDDVDAPAADWAVDPGSFAVVDAVRDVVLAVMGGREIEIDAARERLRSLYIEQNSDRYMDKAIAYYRERMEDE